MSSHLQGPNSIRAIPTCSSAVQGEAGLTSLTERQTGVVVAAVLLLGAAGSVVLTAVAANS